MKIIHYHSELYPRKRKIKIAGEIVLLIVLSIIGLGTLYSLSDYTYYCSHASEYEQAKVDYQLFCYDK